MKHYVVQQNAFADSDRKDSVVCPRPRRLGQTISEPVRSVGWHLCQQAEFCDSKAGNDIIDLILSKQGNGYCPDRSPSQFSSSPPFFCGSPPSRAANPLVRDARFGEEKPGPLPPPLVLPSSPSSARKGCVRTKFGQKPATVRIEGFNCRDRRNCSIPAVA